MQAPTRPSWLSWEQLFFVNAVAPTNIGDKRPYELQVRLMGHAEVISVRTLDLSRREMGLPLSLVFAEGDDAPRGEMEEGDRRVVTDEFSSRQAAEALLEPARPN